MRVHQVSILLAGKSVTFVPWERSLRKVGNASAPPVLRALMPMNLVRNVFLVQPELSHQTGSSVTDVHWVKSPLEVLRSVKPVVVAALPTKIVQIANFVQWVNSRLISEDALIVLLERLLPLLDCANA